MTKLQKTIFDSMDRRIRRRKGLKTAKFLWQVSMKKQKARKLCK